MRILLPVISAAIAALALSASAAAASAPSQLLLDVDFAPRDVAQVEVGDFHFRPGQLAPIHTHAAPAIGYVSKGTIYYQVEGMPAQILKAGDAFYEPVGPRILHFDNASKTQEAVFTDFNLERAGEPFIVFDHPPSEKIDRRTFPTAAVRVNGAQHARAEAIRLTAGHSLAATSNAMVGYVASGSVRIGGRIVQKGQTLSLAAGQPSGIVAGSNGATVIAFTINN